jgi:glycosyltransferase involved in cell wall biosynthesis
LKKKILFLNLTTFSQTGGIEKFNRSFLKALHELECESALYSNAHSLYDDITDENYYPDEKYSGYGQNRIKFVLKSIAKAFRFEYIILGHINLAIIGAIINMLSPRKKVVLIIHGIEVWEGLSPLKRYLLKNTHKVLSVSSFTKNKLLELQKLDADKVHIFPNTIDPYFPIAADFNHDNAIRRKYSAGKEDFILYTLTRLSSKEKYKGYDIVIKCLPEVKKKYADIKYVVAGKYDNEEKERIDKLIAELELGTMVHLAGFIKEEEIVDHYRMSNLFIMPSQKEGFGIVFIEAMACGTPVIAGNIDGSVDAVRNGELGMLVNPENVEEVTAAILKSIEMHKSRDDKYAHWLQ